MQKLALHELVEIQQFCQFAKIELSYAKQQTKSDVPDRVGGVEEQDFQVLGMPPCFEPAKLSWTLPRNSLAEDFHRGSF